MTKARDLANASTALGAVSATELAFVDGVTSAIQTQIDAKAPSSTAVTLTGTQTLTNKTLTSPVIASVVNNTLTSTTGDMIYASAANTPARLGIGSSAQVLTVAGGIPSWATPAGGGGPSFAVYGSAAQNGVANATFVKAALNTEVWDTDNCYDTTLYRFTPNKSGYYQINTVIERTVTSISFAIIALYKNGAQFNRVHLSDSGVNFTANCGTLVYLNGTTDYIEWYVYMDGGTRNIQNDSDQITTGVWIRS